MSFSAESNSEFPVSFMSLEYPNLAPFPIPATTNGHNAGSRFADGNGNGHEPTTADTEEQIKLARVEGALQAHLEYEQKLEAARAPIAAALKSFEKERSEYYARVEGGDRSARPGDCSQDSASGSASRFDVGGHPGENGDGENV